MYGIHFTQRSRVLPMAVPLPFAEPLPVPLHTVRPFQVQELHNRIRWLEVSLQASMAREEVLQGQLAVGGPATRSKSIAVAAVLGAA